MTPSSRSSAAAAPSRDRESMSELRDELYSLLVPLAGERLIVPRACVAEVIGYQPPAEMTNAPPWYLGVVSWGGQSVPVVSFEGAFGQSLPSLSNRTQTRDFSRLHRQAAGRIFRHADPRVPTTRSGQRRRDQAGSVAQLLGTGAGDLSGSHDQRNAADSRFGAARADDCGGNLDHALIGQALRSPKVLCNQASAAIAAVSVRKIAGPQSDRAESRDAERFELFGGKAAFRTYRDFHLRADIAGGGRSIRVPAREAAVGRRPANPRGSGSIAVVRRWSAGDCGRIARRH